MSELFSITDQSTVSVSGPLDAPKALARVDWPDSFNKPPAHAIWHGRTVVITAVKRVTAAGFMCGFISLFIMDMLSNHIDAEMSSSKPLYGLPSWRKSR
jgi:hypothetical protein